MKISSKTRKFIYLISPNKINNPQIFYKELEKILVLKKVHFFQLRLKNQRQDQIIEIGRKIRTLCKKYGTKFIVNDNPYTAKKLSADGCHLGQKDMKFLEAKKIIKNKIIGSIVILFIAIVQPITGGNAPAAPPITIFCGVFFFNQTV